MNALAAVFSICLWHHFIATLPIMIKKYMIKNHLENNKLVTGCF